MGVRPVIVGGLPTKKLSEIGFVRLFTVRPIKTQPLDMLGTGATICVLLQLVGVATVEPNFNTLLPCVAPKFVPVKVTTVPGGP